MTNKQIEQELEKELHITISPTHCGLIKFSDGTNEMFAPTREFMMVWSALLRTRREVETEKVKNAGLQGQLEVEEVAKGIHFELVDILVNYRKERGFGADAPSLTEELNNILVKLATLERENVDAGLLHLADETTIRQLKRKNAELKEANDRLIGTIRSLTETIEAHVDRMEELKTEMERLKEEYSLTPFGVTELKALRESDTRLRAELAEALKDAEEESKLKGSWMADCTKAQAEVARLTKEFTDVRNEAEDADLQLACIADQLGIKGSIKDWLQSIGGAIRDLKAEVERLTLNVLMLDQSSLSAIAKGETVGQLLNRLTAERDELAKAAQKEHT